ncbi:hypothetical protein L7F22_049215 [Adiantum nelumboides]|nr:hypothetical protein [Adiantum nelumboides]
MLREGSWLTSLVRSLWGTRSPSLFANRASDAYAPSVEECSSLGVGSVEMLTRKGEMAELLRQGNSVGNAYSVGRHVPCRSALD